MYDIKLTTEQLDAVIFAVRSDLEVVKSNPDEFEGDAEALQSALDKLVIIRGDK